MSSLHAVLCTYRRPVELDRCLDALARQTRPPDLVVVVDNDDDPRVRAVVERAALPTRYVAPGTNTGPAGGFNAGLEALPEPGADDLVVFVDDDDPPADPRSLARLVSRFDDDPSPDLAGVGLRGGVLDARRGRVHQPRVRRGWVAVDHLQGGYLPVYRRAALDRVGGFDAGLFWGFEELDLGRRLGGAGMRLEVDMDHWVEVEALYPKARQRVGTSVAVEAPSAGRYYSLRNLLTVLARQRAWRAVAEVVAVRAVGKPLLGMAHRPGVAVANLALNAVAVADAAGGRTGRRDRFPALCGLERGTSAPGRSSA